MKNSLLTAALGILVGLLAVPVLACPSCENPEAWTATPCKPTNCSICGYCAYCCERFDIGCENCFAANVSQDASHWLSCSTPDPLTAGEPSAPSPAEAESSAQAPEPRGAVE